MSYKATVVPAAKLTKGNLTYTLHKDDVIDKVIFNFAHGKVELKNAKILDFSLRIAAANKNRRGSVYDSLATHQPSTDNVGNFRDSSVYYDVHSIIVGEFENAQSPNEKIAIEVDKIDTLAGTFTNDDGTSTIGVDLNDETTSLQEAISGASENDIVAVSEGEVTEEITVEQAVTLAGNNAGVPQNHEQEVG